MAGDVEFGELRAQNALLVEENAALRKRVVEQDARIEELERRDNRDSRNSSQPPSSDPPKSRAERRREAREKLKQLSKSKRKPGGQPGHEGKHRQMVPPERVDHRSQHLPQACSCGHTFDGSEERVDDPVIHQQWELPPIRPLVFEYELLRLRCPCCGKPRLAELPAGVSWSAFAARLEAHIATLAGVYRLSRRQVREVCQEVFGIPISLGAVDAAIMRMSQVLKDPWEKLREYIQQAGLVHADETSWRLRGAQQYLWLASSALAACYRIDPHRSQAAAKELLGENFGGFVVSDRYAGYHFLDVLQQQLCWCHVIRQLVEVSERHRAAGRLGKKLVKAAREVINIHRRYLEDDHDLDWLREQLQPLRERIQALLEQGARGRHQRTANFCSGLLDEYEALWTFCDVENIQIPLTNNAAERAVRHAVLLRRIQGGTQSDEGSRWVERICSVRETLRLQDRPVLDYLISAAEAAHHRQPLPSLLPAGP
ncbi:IS66 family transposase [Conexibacter sp. S30A1]|uniref:IS66 family transposase n=1 Tax=Conexibacter sp. S30A1 TaxID=2937800 RepID=UPI00200F1FFC|nr:IS66 family transposase [Conexibacter sp. S30A1]